jgi:hypothetical protein
VPTVYSPPVSTYVPLATIELTSTDSEIVFSSIPATYRDLVLVARGTLNTSNTDILISLNGNTTDANYSRVFMFGDGSTTGSGTTNPRLLTAYAFWGAASQAMFVTQIMDYSATDKHKTILTRGSRASTGVDAVANRFASTAAITTVALTTVAQSFASGATFSLYGIQA